MGGIDFFFIFFIFNFLPLLHFLTFIAFTLINFNSKIEIKIKEIIKKNYSFSSCIFGAK